MSVSLQPVTAAVADNVGLTELMQKIGDALSSGDSLFSLLYGINDRVTALEQATAEIQDSVSAMESSTINMQYTVNSLAGNSVAIEAPALTDVKSTLAASIDANADDYIFTDPANGIEYSVVNYDPLTDELTLFMRKNIGTYSQETSSWGFSDAYVLQCFQDSVEISGLLEYLNVDTDHVKAPTISEFSGVCGSTATRTTGFSYLTRSIITEEPACWVKYQFYYVTGDGSYAKGLYYSYYYYRNPCYQSSSVNENVAPILKFHGNLGEYEYLKSAVLSDWYKMSNNSLGTTGIEVFCKDYTLETAEENIGFLQKKDGAYKFKHDLYINESENNLTSTISNALLTGQAGAKFSIPYTSTMSTKTFVNEDKLGTNHAKYVDVIIRDPANTILYFGRIAKAKLGDNLISFTLPEDLQEDTPYLLQVFEESYYDHQGISTISTPVNARLVIANE